MTNQSLFSRDIAKMSEAERQQYILELCESLKLNPWTKPFEFLVLGNKLTLYATKACAAQLRDLRNISIKSTYSGPLPLGTSADGKPSFVQDVYLVEVEASSVDAEGRVRTTIECGAVGIKGLQHEPLANAIMRAYTKAVRRATLSHAGLGFIDESEIDSIQGAVKLDDTKLGPTTVQPK